LQNNVAIPAFPTNLTSSTWARTVAILEGPVVYYFERTHLFSFDTRDKTVRIFTNCVVDPSFSTDEKRVAVLSHLAGKVSLDVFETATGERHTIYEYPAALAPGLEHSISLSGDGKRVAFVTPERLTEDDRNGTNDVYVAEVDRPGQFRLAKPDSSRATLAVRSAYPSLSEDGRRVTFLSKGNDWSPRLTPLEPRIYLVDLPLRRSEHVTSAHARNPYFSSGYTPPLMMPNGAAVAFGTAEAFIIEDSNASPDAYVATFSMSPMTDLDQDELPDDWETTEFGDLFESADGDFDGDGQSNRLEYLAGTDPVSIGSVLKIEISETTTGGLQLRWATVPGKSYEVQFKANLEEDWDLLSQNYALSNGVAELSLEENQEAGFFRIQVNE
jgi:hypothetical protein